MEPPRKKIKLNHKSYLGSVNQSLQYLVAHPPNYAIHGPRVVREANATPGGGLGVGEAPPNDRHVVVNATERLVIDNENYMEIRNRVIGGEGNELYWKRIKVINIVMLLGSLKRGNRESEEEERFWTHLLTHVEDFYLDNVVIKSATFNSGMSWLLSKAPYLHTLTIQELKLELVSNLKPCRPVAEHNSLQYLMLSDKVNLFTSFKTVNTLSQRAIKILLKQLSSLKGLEVKGFGATKFFEALSSETNYAVIERARKLDYLILDSNEKDLWDMEDYMAKFPKFFGEGLATAAFLKGNLLKYISGVTLERFLHFYSHNLKGITMTLPENPSGYYSMFKNYDFPKLIWLHITLIPNFKATCVPWFDLRNFFGMYNLISFKNCYLGNKREPVYQIENIRDLYCLKPGENCFYDRLDFLQNLQTFSYDLPVTFSNIVLFHLLGLFDNIIKIKICVREPFSIRFILNSRPNLYHLVLNEYSVVDSEDFEESQSRINTNIVTCLGQVYGVNGEEDDAAGD